MRLRISARSVSSDIWSSHKTALVIVTFLHLVVGEMAPKSWAIAHPERSATLLALPMRGFMWLTRPVLRSLNSMANSVLRRLGIEPADQVATGRAPRRCCTSWNTPPTWARSRRATPPS